MKPSLVKWASFDQSSLGILDGMLNNKGIGIDTLDQGY
jgi:hypothetical protein